MGVKEVNGQAQPYGYTLESISQSYNGGSELDEALGLYSTYFRQYDPALGRFTGADALAGSMGSWSPYQYAYNNPFSYIDPWGLSPQGDNSDFVNWLIDWANSVLKDMPEGKNGSVTYSGDQLRAMYATGIPGENWGLGADGEMGYYQKGFYVAPGTWADGERTLHTAVVVSRWVAYEMPEAEGEPLFALADLPSWLGLGMALGEKGSSA
jgi:RHS repeat-associated protein